MSFHSQEPIAAIATPPGRGGIGIVRVSGPDLDSLVGALFDDVPEPRKACYRRFNDAQGEAIDAGVALYFKGPHSYTGEDVLELQGHGGTAVLRRVLERCLEAGAHLGMRHARPGEFTERAFLNERLDLAQAEAVADLIDASSTAAARSAMASLSGVFSARVDALAERIINLRMLVEATLDFPEEEIDFLQSCQAREKLAAIRAELDTVIHQARQSMALREGLYVVLAGQPNVGKSSLLNALAGDDVAIVTPIAGTTRDKVTQQIHVDGVPIHIVDTAGLRDTDDTVESLGIARTWAELEKASVILHLQDIRSHSDTLDQAIVQRLPAGIPALTVLNKVDLVEHNQFEEPDERDSARTLRISAKTGAGLDELKRRLLEIAGRDLGTESPWLARERHLAALTQAGEHLARADDHASRDDQVLDLFAEELRLAHVALCTITGQFTSDDLLGEIFSRFCIGK
jgi:tRNA modification GTPase